MWLGCTILSCSDAFTLQKRYRIFFVMERCCLHKHSLHMVCIRTTCGLFKQRWWSRPTSIGVSPWMVSGWSGESSVWGSLNRLDVEAERMEGAVVSHALSAEKDSLIHRQWIIALDTGNSLKILERMRFPFDALLPRILSTHTQTEDRPDFSAVQPPHKTLLLAAQQTLFMTSRFSRQERMNPSQNSTRGS